MAEPGQRASLENWSRKGFQVQILALAYVTFVNCGRILCEMELIRQKRQNECGMACLAMLSGTSIDDVFAVMTAHGLFHKKRGYRTTKRIVEKTIEAMGLAHSGWMEQEYASPCKLFGWADVARITERTNRNALIGVDAEYVGYNPFTLNGGRSYWHWVVYDPQQRAVLDPLRSKPVLHPRRLWQRHQIEMALYVDQA